MVITKCDFCGREIDSKEENFATFLPRIAMHETSSTVADFTENFQDICPECMQQIINFAKFKNLKEHRGFDRVPTRQNTSVVSYDPINKKYYTIPVKDHKTVTVRDSFLSIDIPALFFDGIEIMYVAEQDNIDIVPNEESEE